MDTNNAFKGQPPMPNHNSNYGPVTQQQPAYNPGWSMPTNGSAVYSNSAGAMPPMPPQINQPMGSYPQPPTAGPGPFSGQMLPQTHTNYNSSMMPPQSNYNPPMMMPPQNNYNPLPPQNNFTPIVTQSYPAPPVTSYLPPSHPQQPRLSNGSLAIPTYNPRPQMSNAYPQPPGMVPLGALVSKDEKKRMKKMMKEQEKMEKKNAKANKYFH